MSRLDFLVLVLQTFCSCFLNQFFNNCFCSVWLEMIGYEEFAVFFCFEFSNIACKRSNSKWFMIVWLVIHRCFIDESLMFSKRNIAGFNVQKHWKHGWSVDVTSNIHQVELMHHWCYWWQHQWIISVTNVFSTEETKRSCHLREIQLLIKLLELVESYECEEIWKQRRIRISHRRSWEK